MGHDANNVLPLGTKEKDIAEFLLILGFNRVSNRFFYFYKDDDYKYKSGTSAEIHDKKEIYDKTDNGLIVWTRTQNACSKFDIDFQNFIIKQLRTRFGGYFESDMGRNRYFKYYGAIREKAEAGCYLCYDKLDSDYSLARAYLSIIEQSKPMFNAIPKDLIDQYHPNVMAINMIMPFMATIIEDYFRSLFIALIRYSDRKESFFKNTKINPTYLLKASNGKISLVEALVRTMSFQNIFVICDNFKRLDSRIDIAAILTKPYERRHENLMSTLDRILEHRHSIIHWRKFETNYELVNAYKDLKSMKIAFDKVYDHLIKVYDWAY